MIGANKIPITHTNNDNDVDENGKPRRCDRLKDKEYVRIEDLVTERAEAKDNYANESIPNLLYLNNTFLLTMTSCIGIDLACTLDMIGNNVEIIRKLEIVRFDMHLNKERKNNSEVTFAHQFL